MHRAVYCLVSALSQKTLWSLGHFLCLFAPLCLIVYFHKIKRSYPFEFDPTFRHSCEFTKVEVGPHSGPLWKHFVTYASPLQINLLFFSVI